MLSLWGKLVYNFAKVLTWLLAKLFFRFRVEGGQHVPRDVGILLTSNHVSHLDPPLVGTAVPRYVFHMAKRELFTVGWLMRFMRTIGTIMVDRGRGQQAVEDAIRYIKHGECVVIFPEGTRSTNGRLMKGRSGAVVIAIRTSCPIQPAVIIGSQKALTKGSKKIKPVPVTVRFGEPYEIDYDGDPEDIPRDVLRLETYKLMERIEALLPEDMKPSADEKQTWYARELAMLEGQGS